MMLLRTIVLEHSGNAAPINGALLCGFAVPHISSNFLAYSMDEETEPGTLRVYIAALQRNADRYLLNSIDTKECLQVAMSVFKQIFTSAATFDEKAPHHTENQIAYHFIDLKSCKLPTARPEDHHSLTIKKALVMKVITFGQSAPGAPAIETSSQVIPSIHFSSQRVAASKGASMAGTQILEQPEPMIAAQFKPAEKSIADLMPQAPGGPPIVTTLADPLPIAMTASIAIFADPRNVATTSIGKEERQSLFEVDSTLTNLARVAQELTQQKLTLLKQQEEQELLRKQLSKEKIDFEKTSRDGAERIVEKEASLQQLAQTLNAGVEHLARSSEAQQTEQCRLEELANRVGTQTTQVHARELAVRRREEQLAGGLEQLAGLRDNLRNLLYCLDETLSSGSEVEQATAERQLGIN